MRFLRKLLGLKCKHLQRKFREKLIILDSEGAVGRVWVSGAGTNRSQKGLTHVCVHVHVYVCARVCVHTGLKCVLFSE